jgi:uncharacterized protein (DUF2141 family)
VHKLLLPYLILAILLLSQCAQQTPLSGGGRDKTAPQLDTTKSVTPPNGSLNFTANRITIPFNEYVKLKDKDKQILITPFLDTPPDIYVKGKKVIVDFKAPLENNTTYIVNFGNSIVDITEGNEVVNFKYVFSTGSYIDSLTYTATIYDAFSKNPVSGAYVMLYKDHQDSILTQEKPNYFGITDVSGNCHIGNIAAGNYKVVSFIDENTNYKWEENKESIAFTEKRFNASKDTLADTLVIFRNYPKELKIVDASVATSGKGLVVFNRGLAKAFSPSADSLVNTFALSESIELNANRDSLFFFVKPELNVGEKYPLGIASAPSRKVMIPSVSDSTLSFKTNAAGGIKPNHHLNFTFSQPITASDQSKVSLTLDEKDVQAELVQTENNKIAIQTNWKAGESYEVMLLPGAVTSYTGLVNDTITAYFETLEDNDFGQLLTTLKTLEGNYIIELIQDDQVKFRDYPTGNEFSRTYGQLFPGNYRLRVIFDANDNGVWDTGDYYNHTQPERVEYYPDLIQIKKGWDMEINWEIRE